MRNNASKAQADKGYRTDQAVKQAKQDDATLVIAAVALAFLLTAINAGEAVLQATATPFVALFFLFLFLLRYAAK